MNKVLINRYNPWTVATWIWMTFLAILVFSTASDYGDSWDEKVRSDAGELKLAYYQNLLSGNVEEAVRITPKGDNYPGFHDLNLALLRRISPFSDYLTGNLFSAMLGLLGIAGTIRLGRLLGGPETGFWAAALLTLLPAWYGHMFINPKDIPFACGYVWGLGYIYQWITGGTAPATRIVILCGMAIGAAMASRIGGLLLLCYLGLFIGIRWMIDLSVSSAGEWKQSVYGAIKCQSPRILAVMCISFFMLMLYWPSGQLRPFTGAGETLKNVTHYDWTMPVFFEGAFLNAPDLPAYYILKMFLFKVPVAIQLLLAVSIVFHCIDLKKFGDTPGPLPLLGRLLVFFSILFPISYVIFRDSILYNGLRHLLFVLPPLSAVAAFGLCRLGQLVQVQRPRLLIPLGIAFLFTLVIPLIHMIRLHPYQYIYYNDFAGGTAAASENYELDYWGTAYKELAEEFYAYLRSERPSFSRPEVVVNMEHVTWLFRPFLPERTSLPIRIVRSQPGDADYYAASTIWAADQYFEGDVVVEISRAGARLGIVKDLRSPQLGH